METHILSSIAKLILDKFKNNTQIPEFYTELLPNSAMKNYLYYWGKLKKKLNKILKNCTISSIHSQKKKKREEGREARKNEGKKIGKESKIDRKVEIWLT